MKKVLLSFCLLTAWVISFAQNQPIDFEAGGYGADWTWTPFENDDNPPVEIIANPDMSGGNMSATVAKYTARQTGNPWAGCETNSGADLGPFVLSASNSTIKIMVWKPVISDVGIKLATPLGWSQGEIKVANTLVNQWEELTFDFSAYVNPPGDQGQLSQIIVFPDFDLAGRTQDNIVYFDNITFSAAITQPEPLSAAPNPTEDPSDVISLFSEEYSSVAVDTWITPWSAATLSDVAVFGNATKKYNNLDFAGIETVSNQVDITEMTHLHVDIWSANFTFFAIKLVDFGADAAFGGGDDVEHQVNFNAPAQQEWVSLDIPLSDFTGLTTQANIAQYIIVAQPSGNANVYLDNLYFFNGTVAPTGPSEPAPTPIQLAENVISMYSDAYTNVPVDTWITSWSAAALEDITIQGNPTKKYSNLDFVGIETVANQLDVTDMTHFHVDVWSADFTFFGIKLVDFGADGAFGGGDDTEHQVNINAPAQEQWVSLDIPLSDFTGLTAQSNIAQFILVGQPTAGTTVYMDNMFFYTTTVTPTGPTEPAPTPIQLAQNVISLYSDAYTNVAVDTWLTSWSSAVLEDITIQGNPTKKYSNLDFAGVESVSNTVDASEMEFIHMDIWSDNFTQFSIKLVDFGADNAFGGGDDTEHQVDIVAPDQEEWVSLDLPLTQFTGLLNRSHLAQYIFVGQPTGTTVVYVDNVFFYKTPVGVESIENAAIPALYPNPIAKGMDVRFGNVTCKIEVFDITGKLMSSTSGSSLQTNGLSQGVYVVKLTAQDGRRSTQQLIIE